MALSRDPLVVINRLYAYNLSFSELVLTNMNIKIKKEKFARNRSRENEVGSFFIKTSSGLTSASSVIIALFFTPALITSSISQKKF